jgi:hypothetical protein
MKLTDEECELAQQSPVALTDKKELKVGNS